MKFQVERETNLDDEILNVQIFQDENRRTIELCLERQSTNKLTVLFVSLLLTSFVAFVQLEQKVKNTRQH